MEPEPHRGRGAYFGSTASTACVTDPLAPPAQSLCTGGHQTKVDFNIAGIPIRIAGPADQTGYWPVTTIVWDSNNNMVCKRTPAANAVSEITGANNSWGKQTRSPHDAGSAPDL